MVTMKDNNSKLLREKALLIARRGLVRFILQMTLPSTLGAVLLCYGVYWLLDVRLFESQLALLMPILAPLTITPVVAFFCFRLFQVLADEHEELLAEVTRCQALEMELRMQANNDMLTGLSNRRAFFEEGHRRLSKWPQTLVLIDLDFFKSVNDEYGHDIGDHVLVKMAQLLSDNFEPEALLSRLGGEEFAFLSSLEPGLLIDQLQEVNRMLVTHPMRIKQHEIEMSLSAGVVSVDQHGDLQEGLIQADTCLYKAKRNGRCQIHSV